VREVNRPELTPLAYVVLALIALLATGLAAFVRLDCGDGDL